LAYGGLSRDQSLTLGFERPRGIWGLIN